MKFCKRSLFIRQNIERIVKEGRLVSLLLYISILVFLSVLAPLGIVFEKLGLRVFTLILIVLSFIWCLWKAIENMRGNPLPNNEKKWDIGKWWVSALLSLIFLSYYLGLFRTDVWP